MEFQMHPIKREIVIDGFNSIYYFEFGKDFYHMPEKHDFWEMVYVDSGEIIAVTDGMGTTLAQGQLIFHSPNEIHAHISDNKNPNNMLVVSFTTNSKAMEYFNKTIFNLNKSEKTILSLFIKEAKNALGKIPNEYVNKDALDFTDSPSGSFQLLECYLTEFLLVLMCRGKVYNRTIYNDDSKNLGQNSTIELIMAFLNENIYRNISLQDVCNKFYMSKSTMCKIFSEHTSTSPMEYYMNTKIKEAKKLLRQSNISISTISDKLGYSSIHNFSRAFKNSVGVSPTEYKRKINGT